MGIEGSLHKRLNRLGRCVGIRDPDLTIGNWSVARFHRPGHHRIGRLAFGMSADQKHLGGLNRGLIAAISRDQIDRGVMPGADASGRYDPVGLCCKAEYGFIAKRRNESPLSGSRFKIASGRGGSAKRSLSRTVIMAAQASCCGHGVVSFLGCWWAIAVILSLIPV